MFPQVQLKQALHLPVRSLPPVTPEAPATQPGSPGLDHQIPFVSQQEAIVPATAQAASPVLDRQSPAVTRQSNHSCYSSGC